MSHTRGSFEQTAKLPTRPIARLGFKRAPGGQHHRNQGAGDVLLGEQRANERQHGDHIHTQAMLASCVDHPPQRGYGTRERGCGPHDIAG